MTFASATEEFIREQIATFCMVQTETDPASIAADVYFYLFKNERDKVIRNLLDNPENVKKVNIAMTKVWEKKKTEEEI